MNMNKYPSSKWSYGNKFAIIWCKKVAYSKAIYLKKKLNCIGLNLSMTKNFQIHKNIAYGDVWLDKNNSFDHCHWWNIDWHKHFID